jgi:hypothetical protein
MARSKSGKHPRSNGDKPDKQAPRPKIPLPLIPANEIERFTIVDREPGITGSLMRGEGGPGAQDFVCGRCGYVLVDAWSGTEPVELENLAVICPNCSEANDLAPVFV